MTQEEINIFRNLKEKFEDETYEIFKYIKTYYKDVLKFGSYSSYHHYGINDKEVWIEYYDCGYDLYDSANIGIPIDDFINRPKEWADEWAKSIRNEKGEKRIKQLKEQEKREKEELERLKKKYESER
jgi:hypothetical protein